MSKDAYYFRHDSNSSNDPKMVALLMRHGMEGYGRFWRLVEILREQSDYRLPNTPISISALAKAWICTTEEAIDFAKSLEVDYELIRSDDNFIWSDSLCRRMGALDSVKSVRSELGRKGAEKRWNSSAIKNDSKGIGSAIRKNSSTIRENSSTKQNDGNVFIDLSTNETGAAPLERGGSVSGEPQEKGLLTKVDFDKLAQLDRAGLIRAARESKKAGIPLLTIERRALQEIGEEPPDPQPPDDFPDDFPEERA